MKKANILDINGKKIKEITLPSFFEEEIRHDIISKFLESQKKAQPYGPHALAGKQHAAKGKFVHRRKVWRSGYGKGMSRVPRKIFLRRGGQFNWEASEIPSARGGPRAHPPKPISSVKNLKINKKEGEKAFKSALSATANPKEISLKYKKKDRGELQGRIPFIVASEITRLKSKEILKSLKKILGESLFDVAIKKKKVRRGKGKLRGRKYRRTSGALIVLGNNEKMNANIIDVKHVKNLGVSDLAKGGPGRLTLYTENAINDLNEKLGKKKQK